MVQSFGFGLGTGTKLNNNLINCRLTSINLSLFYKKKHLAKIRLGSLGIRIESGRYSRPRLEVNQRLCEVCNENFIENEFHFVYSCSKYKALREPWINNLVKPDNFVDLDEGSKLGVALNLSENVKSTARFIMDAFSMRGRILNG